MKNSKMEDLFPVPEKSLEARMERGHYWHHETHGNIEYYVCKNCEKVEMVISYNVNRDYSSFTQETKCLLRPANKGFPCSGA